MPVYLFTFHAYRSWGPDHPRGYVRRNEGILPPDQEMAQHYDRDATHPPVIFDEAMQNHLIEQSREICNRRNFRLHYAATETTHIHVLVSWNETEIQWKTVHDTLKRLLGLSLAKQTAISGRQWFARKGSRKRVSDDEHFEHLMTHYLPGHSGSCWSERDFD